MKEIILSIVVTAIVLTSSPVHGQYIYYSGCPGKCEFDHCGGYSGSMYMYVFASDGLNIEGAHFRLDVEFGPEAVDSLAPGEGVTIESGDLFEGIAVSWTPTELDHYPILRLFGGEPLYTWENWVRDAMLFKTNGDTLFLMDFPTYGGHFDCFDVSFNCCHPDTVEVLIDSPFAIEIICCVTALGPVGTHFDIVDEFDWVADWNPNYAGPNYCESCPWHNTTVIISGMVPYSTPPYSASKLSVYPTYNPFIQDSTSFYLRAVPPVSTQPDTWGGIKSRLGEKE